MTARRRLRLLAGGCLVLCVGAVLVQVSFGTYGMSVQRAWRALFDPILWGSPGRLWNVLSGGGTSGLPTETVIVWTIRLPRVLAALCVGAALGVSGAVFQSLTRNELASPYILGVSSGAGFSVLLVMVFVTSLQAFLPVMAALGGGLAFLGVYLIAWKGGTSPVRLVLAGVVMATLLESLQMAFYLFAGDVGTIQGALGWLIGSLVGVDWETLRHALPWLVVPFLAMLVASRHLDVLALGDRTASGLGMSVEWVRFGFATGAVLLASASVTVAGTIGFVGLIMPHVARSLVGGNSRRIMLASALTGASLLAVTDVAARLLFSPTQVPVGIVTGLVGGGYFLVLMRRGSIAGVGGDTSSDTVRTVASRRDRGSSSSPEAEAASTGIHVQNLELGYGQRSSVVTDASLDVPRGSITVLVGPNGSGKSTLLRGIARRLPPRRGSVFLEGEPLQALSNRELARRVAMLQQEHHLPMEVTVEQLALHGRYPYRAFFGPPDPEDYEAVDRALDQVGIPSERKRPLHELSGGQRQLAWLAMCLAQQSDVLLLDEPTTFLDIVHQYELMDLLETLVDEDEKTVLLVLHDLQKALRYADCLAIMHEGTLVDAGSPDHTLTPQLLRRVFEIRGNVEETASGLRLNVEGPTRNGTGEVRDRSGALDP